VKKQKIPKIIFANISVLLILTLPIEFFLGNWKKNFFGKNKYIQIPGLVKNISLKYDASSLYESKEPIIINYYRDELGYRSKNQTKNKPIILTIGGSTTDNKFVTEGKTWQDNLDKLSPKYDFINGGIDGQSSYGHLRSINSWHSKNLKNYNIEKIIFYIGLSDISLLNKNIRKFDLPQSKKEYIKNLLKDNSFFIGQLLSLRNRIEFLSRKKNSDLFNVHQKRNKEFLKKGVRFEYTGKDNINSNFYKNTFSNLLTETKKSFPNSEIIVIQEQIPGCNFINRDVVFDRHQNSLKKNKFKCLDLLKVYQMQSETIKKYEFTKVKIYPMFLEKILNDNDIYDYVHTNNTGALKIAKYINSLLNE